KGNDLPKIDLLFGGSPCQSFSSFGNEGTDISESLHDVIAMQNHAILVGDKGTIYYLAGDSIKKMTLPYCSNFWMKSVYFAVTNTKCENPLEKLFKFILYTKEINNQKCKFKIIGFNNSRFDNFFLVSVAEKYKCTSSVFYVNNSILDFRIVGNTSFDLCRFLNCSLKDACNDYETVPKKLEGFSHREPQQAFESGSLIQWIETNYIKLEEYNKLDVLSLVDLTLKVKNTVHVLTNGQINLTTFMTIGQMGYKFNQMKQEENNVVIKPPKTLEDDRFIRSALTAGRTQCYYGRKKMEIALRMVDAKSLYPYVMMNRSFPSGDYGETNEYVEGKLGIYECVIKHQNLKWKGEGIQDFFNKYPEYKKEYAPIVYPLRSNKLDVPLNWEYRGKMKCRLTSVDIECIRDYGGEVEVKNGIYWLESDDKIFTYYLEIFMNEKNKQDRLKKLKSKLYNPCLRAFCKLMSNCISGKVSQKNYLDMFERVKGDKEIDKFLSKVEKDSVKIMNHGGGNIFMSGKKKEEFIFNENNAKPSYLGVFIYAYARDYMYRSILGSYCTLYEDTDSALMPKVEYERFKQNNVAIFDTGEYGCFEEEVENATISYTFAPKFYCVINRDNDKLSKYKCKGVRKNDNYITLNELTKLNLNPREMNEDQIKEIFYNNQDNKTLNEKMFEDIYKGETICVFQSQLQKIKGTLGDSKSSESKILLTKKQLELTLEIENNNKLIRDTDDNELINKIKFKNEKLKKKCKRLDNKLNISGFEIKQRYLVKILAPP
ncbi:MAG: DNA polymerase, partial [Candidatus Thorarchaeota archaeon]